MRPLEILILYLIIGAAVGLSQHRAGRAGSWLSVPFWPLFLPTLLGETGGAPEGNRPDLGWKARIEAATAGLAGALGGMEGARHGPEVSASLKHLNIKLFELSDRLDHLERVLSGPEHAPEALERALQAASPSARPLVEARLQNEGRLRALRAERREELEQALAMLDDLATRAHLARFTGDAAETVAGELLKLTAAVDTGGELAQLSLGAAQRR